MCMARSCTGCWRELEEIPFRRPDVFGAVNFALISRPAAELSGFP